MSRPKPSVPVSYRSLTCICTGADPVACLALWCRATDNLNLVRLLTNGQGCACACHRVDSGAQIAHEQWRRVKVRVK